MITVGAISHDNELDHFYVFEFTKINFLEITDLLSPEHLKVPKNYLEMTQFWAWD